MATKYHLFLGDVEVPEATRSKKDAVIKIGDATERPYEVRTDTGTVVHVVDKVEPSKASDEITEHMKSESYKDDVTSETDEVLYYEFIDFPGNYSIVTAPLALEIAEAAGVPAKSENTKGLTRKVSFGGPDMDKAKQVKGLVESTVKDILADLHEWQKKHVERRRGLTDMQRYLEHREFIAKAGHKVALRVKKEGLL